MDKYYKIGKISLKQEFAYKINFVMWRVRNILQILLVYFLWDSVFSNSSTPVFGYDRPKMLTYVIGLLFVRAFVLSAKAMEVAGEISRGDLNNYSVKPVNYFKYWLSRDIASKLLNLIFALFEIFLVFIFLKPDFYFQANPLLLTLFVVSLLMAVFLYFLLIFMVSLIPFWAPEIAWGGHFLITVVILEFLSGAIFPLDILPSGIMKIVNFTPFPYLIFFPIQIYIGKIEAPAIFQGILVVGIWIIIFYWLLKVLWRKGLKVYEAYGR